MANIQDFLNKIKEAVYGKEVRQAIHDAISQCYDDVSNPTLNTEAFEAMIQKKIDDGSIANATIADGSITKEKLSPDINLEIEDGSVTPEKTSFIKIERQENLVTEVVTVSNHPTAVIENGASAGTTLYFNVAGINTLQIYDEDSDTWVTGSFSTYGTNSPYVSNSTGNWVLTSDVPKFRVYGSAVWTWDNPAINTTGVFFDGYVINGIDDDFTKAIKTRAIEIVETGLNGATEIITPEMTSFVNKKFQPIGHLEYPTNGTGTVIYKFTLEAGKTYYGGSELLYKGSDYNTYYTMTKTNDGGKTLGDLEAGEYFNKLEYFSNDQEGILEYVKNFKKWFLEYPIGDNYKITQDMIDFIPNNPVIDRFIKSLNCDLVNKRWNALGDSNTQYPGGYQSWQSSNGRRGYVQAIGDKYYMSAKNNGSGGATWGTASGSNCAVNKVDSLVSDGVQWDIVTFSYGTNSDTSTGTYESTSEDKTSLAGAMRYCIETMQASFPLTKLGVILPTRRSDGNLSNDVLKERCELMKEIASDYGVKVCDMFNESGTITSWYSDGLHICNAGSWDYTKPACFHYQNNIEKFLLSL